MEETRGNIWKFLVCGAVVIAALLYSADQLFIRGILAWNWKQEQYHEMAGELILLFALFFVLFAFLEKWWVKMVSAAVVLSVFLWGHMVFVPVVVSGLYGVYLIVLGRFLRSGLLRLPSEDGPAVDFLSGSVLVILIFCLMSAAGIGTIAWLQGFVVITGIFLIIWRFSCRGRACFHGIFRLGGRAGDWWQAFCLAFIVTMVCLQAGRINIALDFDSLWYGVRSPYILENGNGIYENLGTIGVVYTYSKGLEVLALPLSNLPSYSFFLSFNLWLTAGVLMMGYWISRHFMGREYSLASAALLSAIPGIMNMGVTAKTDIATLLFQLIMLEALVLFLKNGRRTWRYLMYALSAFMITWTLKPTALVFSTAVLGMSVLFFLLNGRKAARRNERKVPPAGAWRNGMAGGGKRAPQAGSLIVFLISLAALAGIWARTMMITGLPITSVFSSILTKIGFQMKYPFNVSKIPNAGADLSFAEQIANFAKRFFGFMLRPLGKDMDHVILAWGGFALFAMFMVWIVCCFPKSRLRKSGRVFDEKNEDRGSSPLLSSYLNVIYIPFLFVNVVSLFMLYQVDGNYFMLLYVLTVIYVLWQADRVRYVPVRAGIRYLMVPVMCFGAVTASLINWGWTLGFSPLSWNHSGYYNHMEENHREMAAKGNEEIWDILAEDPGARLIAVGTHPGVLLFPCSAQSYDDIASSWGNVVLVKTMDNFVEFMEWAKTDYVYTEAGYMQEEDRSYSLVRTLIEYGKLVPVCYENGNMLAQVVVSGEHTALSVEALAEFDRQYKMKEMEESNETEKT